MDVSCEGIPCIIQLIGNFGLAVTVHRSNQIRLERDLETLVEDN